MSWRVTARRDVRDAVRSRTVWLLIGLLAIAFVGYAFVHAHVGDTAFVVFLDGLAGLVGGIVPLLALLLGYNSVGADRESGSLLLTLSLPHSRRDVVIGTFLGRSIVMLVPTVTVLSVAGVIGAIRYGTDGAALYPWFLFATALYGAAFVGIAVGLSSLSIAGRRLTTAAVGAYLALVSFYDGIHALVLLVLHRGRLQVLTDLPGWALLFRLAQPSESYYRLVRLGFDIDRATRYVGVDAPLYVGWWMGLLLLVAWALGPLALGYRRFRRGDL
jgi:ABC-type transport system involved in multi-copper enzyme maturation permease subunit